MSGIFLKHAPASYPPRILCFVCASEGPADYPIYSDPPGGQQTRPHFPFLLAHAPPAGYQPVEATGGEAKVCRHCYTSLLRQWDEYERARMPLIRRAYWVRRADDIPFLTPEEQARAAMAQQTRQAVAALPPNTIPAASVAAAAAAAAANTAAVVQPASSARSMGAPMPPIEAAPTAKSLSMPLAHHHLTAWTRPSSDLKRPAPSSLPSRAAPPTSSSDEVIIVGGNVPAPPVTTASASINAPPTSITTGGGGGGDNDSALDLSSGSRERETMKSRSSVASHISVVSHHSSYQSEGAGSSTDILDLTLPDKNALTEVSETLALIYPHVCLLEGVLRLRRGVQARNTELHLRQADVSRRAILPKSDVSLASAQISPDGLLGARTDLRRVPRPPPQAVVQVRGGGSGPRRSTIRRKTRDSDSTYITRLMTPL